MELQNTRCDFEIVKINKSEDDRRGLGPLYRRRLMTTMQQNMNGGIGQREFENGKAGLARN